jgi:hypothetical protein
VKIVVAVMFSAIIKVPQAIGLVFIVLLCYGTISIAVVIFSLIVVTKEDMFVAHNDINRYQQIKAFLQRSGEKSGFFLTFC